MGVGNESCRFDSRVISNCSPSKKTASQDLWLSGEKTAIEDWKIKCFILGNLSRAQEFNWCL